MKLLKTKLYSKFKTVKGNRRIVRAHLKNLMMSLTKKNLLPTNPIIVNERMEIIDGQHRLEAAKRLHLEIFYTVVKGATIADVQMLNSSLRPWQFDDYINSYKAAGNKNYFILDDYRKKHGLPVGLALQLLTGQHTGKMSLIQDFKEGQFEVKELDDATQFAQELTNYRKYAANGAAKDREYAAAVLFMHDNKPVSHLSMLEKMQKYCIDDETKFHYQPSAKEYIRSFESLYNRFSKKNEVRFF